MAKRGTLDHPKTLHLARLLKVEPWAALGLLEALWHWSGKYAPTGDLSSIDPRAMAEGMRVRRCPTRVLAFLTESSWIDRVGEKLYIHDWPDHADDATKKLLQRSGRTFSSYYSTVSRRRSSTLSLQCPDDVPTVARLPEPEPEPLPEPEPVPPTPSRRLATLLDSDKADAGRFQEFFDRYPHRIGKQAALQTWISLVTPETEPLVFACLERYERSQEWQRKVYQQPANWLRDRARNGWADEPSPAAPAKSARQLQIERL